jgi:hypothetical protein
LETRLSSARDSTVCQLARDGLQLRVDRVGYLGDEAAAGNVDDRLHWPSCTAASAKHAGRLPHAYPYTNAVFVRGFESTHAASFFGSLWNTSKARRDMDGRPPIGEFSFYAERWLTFGFWIDL